MTTKRLSYRISKKDMAVIKLMMRLGNPYRFEKGMKVRFTYLTRPIWFYGKIIGIFFSGRYLEIRLEKAPRELLSLKKRHFVISIARRWVEPYDY